MAEQFANDVETTLNGAIDDNDTTLVVTSATGFPTTGDFRIRIDNEIMTVTAVSGTTFTISRATEPVGGVQTAASHSNGAVIKHVLTAGALQNFVPPIRITVVQESDISIAVTLTTILDISLTTGTWTIWAFYRVYAASNAPMHIYPQIYDVTNDSVLYQGTEIIALNNNYREMSLMAETTLTSNATLRLRANGDNTGAHALGGSGTIRITAIKTAS